MTGELNPGDELSCSRVEYSVELSRRINPDLTPNQALVEGVVIAENVDKFVHESDPEIRAQIIADCLKNISKAQKLLNE